MLNTLASIFSNRQFQGIAAIQVLNVFGANLLAPVLPLYLSVQGLSASDVGMIMGIMAIGALVMRPWAGRAVDSQGSRPVILLGQALLGICFASFLLFTGFWPLLLVRFVQGAAQSFYSTASVTFASSVESPQNTASAISMYTVFTMVGLGSATSLAPFLYNALGFPALVLITLLTLGAASSVAVWRTRPIPPLRDAVLQPFAEVLRIKAVWAPTVCLFASNFVFSTLFTFVPLYALSESVAGYSVFYVSFAVAVIITRMGVQQLTRSFRAEKVATAASLMNVASALLLSLHPSPFTFAVSGILVGLGFGVIFPALTVYVIERISPAVKGTGLSILTAAGDVGNALGAAILGIIAEWLGFRWVFAISAAVVLVCARYFYDTLVVRQQKDLQE